MGNSCRYKDTPNIIWVAGGDNDAKDIDEPYPQNPHRRHAVIR
ncbi:MAG: hypothetical protein R2806_10970 [Saprospiraceae bacterium]